MTEFVVRRTLLWVKDTVRWQKSKLKGKGDKGRAGHTGTTPAGRRCISRHP